jgi:predicted transport protein/uncharacterized protein with ParB-like and HNH nuclease domain
MKAKEANFLRFLHGAKQFIIPIYQRTYSWQLKQCEQLLKDIIAINADEQRPGHFIGSIVYFEEDIHTVSEVPQLLVIDGQQYASIFDGFMRHYLTVKTGQIPKINEVYEKYKEYSQSQLIDKITEDIVKDIYNYSVYYVRMALFQEPDKALNTAFKDLSVLRVDVAYPMLLELYNDYEEGKLALEELTQAVRMIESYVFRRVICGIPTNSLNKTFSRFMRNVNKDQYLESVQAEFLLMTSYRRFPLDGEMRREMLIKDVYNLRTRNYLLKKLENKDRKEKVNVEEYTIEHILPQNPNLSEQWKTELGENWKDVQEKYLHTIGNITLTGYNSELSDRPFQNKKKLEGGFSDSPLRLNKSVANKDVWNEASITSRAKELIDKAIQIWEIPDLEEAVLDAYREAKNIKDRPEYDLAHYEMPPEMLELYQALKQRILNIDSSVSEEYKKLYIAFKTSTNFVDIVPQKKRLRLSLNLGMDEINDPKELCKDVSNLGRWGNGDVEVGFSSLDEIDDIMDLIHQSYEKHSEYVVSSE